MTKRFRDYLSENTDGDVVVYTIDKRDIVEMINAEIKSYNNINDENEDFVQIDTVSVKDLNKELIESIIKSYKELIDHYIFQLSGGVKLHKIIAPHDTWDIIEEYVESLNKK